ncbi:hypothetical protein [Palleronia abyssalis]|uniref:Chromosome partition protein Smc n=1 Tax=Palleronia abyssalis TaxID=1501240 RepID=A0A2R8BZ37_9RHOB|nr:hypothetical protein [Palleronia abyssalis]SPJ25373.1 hypothetical protein PAA8504_03224 [Palleronia abyssalis]
MGNVARFIVLSAAMLIASSSTAQEQPLAEDALTTMRDANRIRQRILAQQSSLVDARVYLEHLDRRRRQRGLDALGGQERERAKELVVSLRAAEREFWRVFAEGNQEIEEELELARRQAEEAARDRQQRIDHQKMNSLVMGLFNGILKVADAYEVAEAQAELRDMGGDAPRPHEQGNLRSPAGEENAYVELDAGDSWEEILDPLNTNVESYKFFSKMPTTFDLCFEESWDWYVDAFPAWEGRVAGGELNTVKATIVSGILWDCGYAGRRHSRYVPAD